MADLIGRGGAQALAFTRRGGVWVFELPTDAPQVTNRLVRQLLDNVE